MRDGQRVAFNTVVMVVKQVVMAVLGIVFVGYMARKVGVSDWGEFQASLALTSMLTVIAGIGVRGYLAREIAVTPELGPTHLGAALAIRGVTGTLLLGATVVVALAASDRTSGVLITLAAISQLASLLYSTMWLSFEAHERFQYILYVELAARLFVIGSASTLLAFGFGVVAAATAFMVGNLLELALTYFFLRRALYTPRLRATPAEMWRITKASVPIGLLGAIITALQQTDRVMLRWLVDESAVGVYSAAWVLSENCNLLADLFLGASFAAGMRLFARDQGRFRELFQNCFLVALCLSLPMASGAILLAPDLIRLVYGSSGGYEAAIPVLRVLALQLPVMFAFQVTTLPLLAAKREVALGKLLAVSWLAKVALGFVVIPRMGALGAALTTLLVTAGTFVASSRLVSAHLGGMSRRRVVAVAFATALMSVVAFGARSLGGMWASVGAGAAAYVALLLMLGGITRAELAGLLRRRAPAEDAPALS